VRGPRRLRDGDDRRLRRGTNTFVVHARIRWPDGETLDVQADATDRSRLEQLLAAVRTIRRTGA
jgi:hypothetical protein